MKKNTFIEGTIILAVAGTVVKFLGLFFKVPLANIIGDVGMANYAPAYSLYGFLLIFATSGFSVAISKLVSEKKAVNDHVNAANILSVAKIIMGSIGVACALILFLFADSIANMISIPGSAISMKITAFSLVLVPLMASYRGYFQGMQKMWPTALSELVEQLFRVIFGILLAVLLIKSDFMFQESSLEERGAAGGCVGGVIGATAGLMIVLLLYVHDRKIKALKVPTIDRYVNREPQLDVSKKILNIALPITLGAVITPLMNLADTFFVTRRLVALGFDSITAEGLCGQLSSFATPMIGIPDVILRAVAIAIVPAVAGAYKLNDMKTCENRVKLGLRMTTIIGFPCTAGLFTLAKPILLLLYPKQAESAASASDCLEILSIGVIFLALTTTVTGVLQGVGKQNLPVRNLIIGLVVKVIGTICFTSIEVLNIRGAALSTLISYMTIAVLNVLSLKRQFSFNIGILKLSVKPMVASLVMGIVIACLYKLIYQPIGSNAVATIISVCIGVILYGIEAVKMKMISKTEITSLPFGDKAAVMLEKLHLW